jgi:hypothetical protein
VYVIQSNEIKHLHDWNVGRNRTYWLTSNDLPLAALVKMLSMSEPVLSEVGIIAYSRSNLSHFPFYFESYKFERFALFVFLYILRILLVQSLYLIICKPEPDMKIEIEFKTG